MGGVNRRIDSQGRPRVVAYLPRKSSTARLKSSGFSNSGTCPHCSKTSRSCGFGGGVAHFGACQLATEITKSCLLISFLGNMTPEESTEMERLCRLIQHEKDPNKFTQLVYRLNSLFRRKERRLNGDLRSRPWRVIARELTFVEKWDHGRLSRLLKELNHAYDEQKGTTHSSDDHDLPTRRQTDNPQHSISRGALPTERSE
jgi:hypothetical protein